MQEQGHSTVERDHQSAIIRYWDCVAARYLELFRDEIRDKPFDLALLRKLADSIGKGARACDVGCGPCAHVTRFLADAGLDIIGIDISPACINLARREQSSIEFRLMDAAALEFPTSSFDGLIAYYLLHYLPLRSWPQVLSGFARVLRPGGRLLVVQKIGRGEAWIPDPMGSDAETFWAATQQAELEEIVVSAGFRLLEGLTRGPLPAEIAVDRIYLLAERAKSGYVTAQFEESRQLSGCQSPESTLWAGYRIRPTSSSAWCCPRPDRNP